MAITSFRNTATRDISKGTFVPSGQQLVPSSVQMQARGQLAVLERTKSLDELRRKFALEKLGGQRKGEYLLPINKEFGICFFWDDNSKDAEDVEIINLKQAALQTIKWDGK